MPAETPYLTSCQKRAVCGDWMVEVVGLKLATHHPVIEPVSATRAGNGNLRCRHGCAKAAVLPAEIDPATRRGGKTRGVAGYACETACINSQTSDSNWPRSAHLPHLARHRRKPRWPDRSPLQTGRRLAFWIGRHHCFPLRTARDSFLFCSNCNRTGLLGFAPPASFAANF
jgi:hypothetical protein